MQKMSEQTSALLLATEAELFNKIINKDHPFRKLKEIINFEELTLPLRELYSDLGQTGVDVQKGFQALLIQFWEDYSDRQMEKAVKENLAIRWFCGFSLAEETPDHTYFCKLRKRLGTQYLADAFAAINARLQSLGLFGNVFTFIDALCPRPPYGRNGIAPLKTARKRSIMPMYPRMPPIKMPVGGPRGRRTFGTDTSDTMP